MAKINTYDASSIQILENIEAIQKRPGMYIGDVSHGGVEVCFNETVSNCVDEHMNGHGNLIEVSIDSSTGVMTVTDHARGIPVDEHPKFKGISVLEVLFTRSHSGGKFGEEYGVAGGLHGIGLKVNTAMSTSLDVDVYREGSKHSLSFRNSKRTGPLRVERLPPKQARRTGTSIAVRLDPARFPDAESTVVSLESARRSLRERAFLNPELTLTLSYDGAPLETFHEPEGLAKLVAEQAGEDRLFQKVASLDNGAASAIRAFVAVGWSSGQRKSALGFCNGMRQPDGGTHIQGLQMGLSPVVRDYIVANKMIAAKDGDLKIEPADCWEGVYAVVAVRHRAPVFRGQAKTSLGNSDVQGAVSSLVRAQLAQWMEENPREAKLLAGKAVLAARARVAAAKAKDQVRKEGEGTFGMSSFGKLADCSLRDPERTEIFLVEGDSAGGSAKTGRDRRTQAVYPLKGKPMNTWEKDQAGVISNVELSDLTAALGCGLFDPGMTEEEIEAAVGKLRYHKIIVMSDADIDGCLAGDTEVATSEGPVKIAELAARQIRGEAPLSGWALTNENETVMVPLTLARRTRSVRRAARVTFSDGTTLLCTVEHPVLTERGDVQAGDLLVGDLLRGTI